jgi:integrase/recombinase XerC
MPKPKTAPPLGAAARFARHLEQSERSRLTVKSYQSDLQGFALWFQRTNGDAMEPDKITPTDLRQYKQWLLNVQRRKPNTINRKLATLRSFLRWALEAGLAVSNKAFASGENGKGPRRVREERPAPRWLNRQEQSALFRSIERAGSQRDLAVMLLLTNTGLRVQELCDLTWQDVKISERKGTLVVRNGKGEKHREIPLNKDARAALCALGYAEHSGDQSPILRGQRGQLKPRGVQFLFAKHAQAAKLDDVSPHSLRHTFCKNLVDAGVGLEKVAALAGHESLETTRRYCEPSRQDLERAVDLIGESE